MFQVTYTIRGCRERATFSNEGHALAFAASVLGELIEWEVWAGSNLILRNYFGGPALTSSCAST